MYKYTFPWLVHILLQENKSQWCSTMCVDSLFHTTWTLILPGEVKVDRQLWCQIPDKILIYWICFKLTYSCRNVLQIFLSFLKWHQKMTFWHPFWHFFVRSSVTERLCHPPCFQPVLLLLQTTWAREKSQWAMVHSQHSDQFLVLGHVECGGGKFSGGPVSRSFSV